jgi:cytochrome c-type biogenesis protein CcmH
MTLFYIVAGTLALLTVLVIVRPLLTGRASGHARGGHDAGLYRDQLGELERDLARGTISAGEAEGARAEISRRLIDAVGRAETAGVAGPAPRLHSSLLAVVALIGAPALTLALYLAIGMPGQRDLPLAERSPDEFLQQARPSQVEAETAFTPDPLLPLTGEQQEYAALIIRLEALLEQRPDDVRGLELLANGYLRLQRFGESWRTYDRLTTVMGAEAEAGHFASMAEAMVLAAGGYVSPEAERALSEALARDGTLPVARYYTGLLMAQDGQLDSAIATWERLKAETPADAPWREFLDGMLTEAKAVRSGARSGPADTGTGPSAADIEAAGALSPEERQEMIEGMVAQLEARLTSTGGEVEEWLRLMNAYNQMGRRDDAARIARLGIAAFGNSGEAGFLREQALVMGVIEE